MIISDFKLEFDEKLVRDASFESFGMSGDERAGLFVPVSTAAHLVKALNNPGVVAIAAPPQLAGDVPERLGLLVSPEPLDFVYRSHCDAFEAGAYARRAASQSGAGTLIHETAVVAREGVVIGSGCSIGPGVVIESGTTIGDGVVVGAGTVLGGNGFEVRDVRKQRRVIPHVGGVRVGDRVEIQANTCVCRALFGGETEIGDDSVIDNLIHVAHNAKIGRRCKVVACAMIGGSVKIGDDVWIGPNATVSNGLFIGDGAAVSLGAVVTRDVAPGTRVTGSFALEHQHFLKAFRGFMGLGRD